MSVADIRVTQYRDETIAEYELSDSLLRGMVTTEAVVSGQTARFLVSGSKDQEATTRGSDGNIPSNQPNNTPYDCILTEEHSKQKYTSYDIFTAQGQQREQLQKASLAVLRRRADEQIIEQLELSPQDTGTAAIGSTALMLYALTILGNNEVEYDGRICAAITPSCLAYLLQDDGFANADFVNTKPLDGAAPSPMGWGYYMWGMMKIVVHPRLPGRGTNAEKCFVWHENSVGHASDRGGMGVHIGYNEEDDYSFSRATEFMGAKLLDSDGVVVINHNGSAHQAN